MNRSGNIGAAKNMDSVFDNFTDEELEQDLIFDEDDQLVEIVEGYHDNGETIFEEDEEIFKIADEIMNDDSFPEMLLFTIEMKMVSMIVIKSIPRSTQ